MGEDSSRAERSSSNSSSTNNNNNPSSPVLPQQQQQQQHENMDLLIPSFSPSSAPSSPTHTLTRLGLRSPLPGPGSSPVERGQVSAITVVALLDKLVHMLEAVQENQRRMERRQAELEGAVRGVQGDVTRLSKSHAATSGSVAKLLERSRKAGGHMKEVRARMDTQAAQVKRLEANHVQLLKRNHFKVLIFQDDAEIPSSVLVKDPAVKPPRPASQLDADEEAASQTAASVRGVASRSHDEGLHTISLTSDEDEDSARPRHEEDEEDDEPLQRAATLGPGVGAGAHSSSHAESSRADKLKRSSLRKVDSLKRAFSRQSIEKKMSKIGTKIVPPERREQIKKSFAAPNRPKSPAAKSSSFRVAPMTFNVTKVRDGGEAAAAAPAGGSPGRLAHVEIPRLGSLDGDGPLAAVLHSQEDGAGGREEERAEEEEETASPSTPGCPEIELAVNGGVVSSEIELTVNGGAESSEIDLAVNGEGAASPEIDLAVNGKAVSSEIDPDANRPAKLAFPERDEDEEEEDDDDNNEELERENPGAPAAPLPAAAITVEQAS